MRLIKVSSEMDWRRVELDFPSELIYEHVVPGYEKGDYRLEEQNGNFDFRINLTKSVPFLVEANSGWAKVIKWDIVEALLSPWKFNREQILVVETIYGKSDQAVWAEYLGEGNYKSQHGDEWKLNELIQWLS